MLNSSSKKRSSSTTGRASPPLDDSVEGNIKRLLADRDEESLDSQLAEALANQPADAPMIRLVNALLSEAVKQGASDVHLEPFESMFRVRYRVDGVLREVQKIPQKLASGIAARLKIMADLDICEKRIPQDGSFKLKLETADAEFRMSTLPSQFGEKIVMRVMGNASTNNDLSKLGLPAKQLKLIREAIHRPDGLVLVTGPTGSGKTTTLYAALNELNDISVSVFTAEDPIEGSLQGVTQCQVNTAVGYTFATMLRSFIRQDPDVILVGEIRDQETAEISIKAALTGHLVLSTLHTNCSVSTVQRLLNMGVPAYLITTSMTCVVAQRLVRRICSECKEVNHSTDDLLRQLGSGKEVLQGKKIFHGRGCKKCSNTGYRGRAPLYEVLVLNDELRAAILQGASREQLKYLAMNEGMITLRRAGLELVAEGITTIEEILGTTTEDNEKPMAAFVPVSASAPTQLQPSPQIVYSAPQMPTSVPLPSQEGLPLAKPATSTPPSQAVSPPPKPSTGSQRWKALKTVKA